MSIPIDAGGQRHMLSLEVLAIRSVEPVRRRSRARLALAIAVAALLLPGNALATCGDADDSGSVSVTDGVNELRAAADLFAVCAPRFGDMDGNGHISVTDGVNTLRLAAQLSATRSCPPRGSELIDQVQTQTGVQGELHDGAAPPGGTKVTLVAVGETDISAGGTNPFVVTFVGEANGATDVRLIVTARRPNDEQAIGFFELPLPSGAEIDVTYPRDLEGGPFLLELATVMDGVTSRYVSVDQVGTGPFCGDEHVDAGEDCDPPGSVCGSENVCVEGCRCSSLIECGNGLREGDEECDGSDSGFCDGSDCLSDCTCASPVCGNDRRERTEQCDGLDVDECGHELCIGCQCTSSVLDGAANRNPGSCLNSSVGISLFGARDSPRCRGGLNNFVPCTSDSECPGGVCAPGGTCFSGFNINEPCTVDSECPGSACTLGDDPADGPVQVGEAIYYLVLLGFNTSPNACGYEGGRVCVDLPGAGCPSGFDRVPSQRICSSGTNDGAPCTSDSACPQGSCVQDDCCEVTPSRFCIGGNDAGAPCNVGSDCATNICERHCEGGTAAGAACSANNIQTCTGGDNHGRSCNADSQCPGGFCDLNAECPGYGRCIGGVPLICPLGFGCQPSGELLFKLAREIPYVARAEDAEPPGDPQEVRCPSGYLAKARFDRGRGHTGREASRLETEAMTCSGPAFVPRNPDTCRGAGGGVGFGAARDTQRCRAGANNFAPCTAGSECPGGRCARGGTCASGASLNLPCDDDRGCVDAACLFGDEPIVDAPVLEGETLYYQALLGFNTAPFACGFDGGTLSIRVPSGETMDVTPTGSIPLICPFGFGCAPTGKQFVYSKEAPYEVHVSDADDAICPGLLRAVVEYKNGIAKDQALSRLGGKSNFCLPVITPTPVP